MQKKNEWGGEAYMIVEISGAEKAWGEREWRGGSHENWRGVMEGFYF